jgi:hypothetical protein
MKRDLGPKKNRDVPRLFKAHPTLTFPRAEAVVLIRPAKMDAGVSAFWPIAVLHGDAGPRKGIQTPVSSRNWRSEVRKTRVSTSQLELSVWSFI